MPSINLPKSLPMWERAVALVSIGLCTLVMAGWFLKVEAILNIIPGEATMKFNTALILLLSGIGLLICKKNQPYFQKILKLIATILLLIGSLTLLAYSGMNYIPIDELFVKDPYSISHPGRMSPGTAFCTVMMGVSFLSYNSRKKKWIKVCLYALKIILFTSLVAIIAFILLIPRENKTSFFNTMAIHTSLLFMGIALILIFNNKYSLLRVLIFGNYAGSRSTRRLIPAILLIPTVLTVALVAALEKGLIDIYFGIAAFATLSVPLIILYVAYVAVGLNRVDSKRLRLQQSLIDRNRQLQQFRVGLERVASISRTDRNGVITYVNDWFCQLSEYPREELVGKTHKVISTKHHKKSFYKKMYKTISQGEVWYGHFKNRKKSGKKYWVEVLIIPFKNSQGEIIEYMSLQNDITERKKAEKILKSEYVRSLEFKNKELQELTYIASHDLQEPLITLLSLTSDLSETQKDRLDDEGKTTLKFIEQTSKRMSNQIKGILDYNLQFENLNIQKVNCNEVVKDILDDMSDKIEKTKAEIHYEGLPTIKGYETPIRMLFMNLISNALKFQEKGSVPKIEITAKQKDSKWQFAIKDNGIGIESWNLEKIFNIFQRLQKRSLYDGSGIGLAHCKKIIDLHSGRIWVKSDLGKGSTFYFTIPTFIKKIKSDGFFNPE